MKIKDIKEGSSGFVKGLVIKTEEREGKRGPYTAITFTDGEQTISINKWCRREEFEMDGTVLEIELIIKNGYYNMGTYSYVSGEDESDYIPQAPIKAEDSYNEMVTEISHMSSPDLRNIVYTILSERKDDFLRWSAAKSMHHNYVKGLLYHEYRMMKTAIAVSDIYHLDKDLMVAGVLLHDICKIEEMATDEMGEATYTVYGNLFGHLFMGAKLISDTCAKLGIDETKEDIMLLKHMILSHHRKQEYGAVMPPATKEALALSFIDAMDADIWKYEHELSKINQPEGEIGTCGEFWMGKDRAVVYKPVKVID